VSPQHIAVSFSCITPVMMGKESITAMAHLNLVLYLLDMIQEIMLVDATDVCQSRV
jgi:hypothetical protein